MFEYVKMKIVQQAENPRWLFRGFVGTKKQQNMKTITDLQNQYDEMKKVMFNLSNEIIQHLHDVYDSKLDSFKTFDDFLVDINNYAGDTFGKLMYINHAKNVFNKREHSN